jgi:hypothetical protein
MKMVKLLVVKAQHNGPDNLTIRNIMTVDYQYQIGIQLRFTGLKSLLQTGRIENYESTRF